MPRQKAPLPQAAIPDPEAHAVLVQAMADVGADPALVYAFQKTGIYVCEENEKHLSKANLAAFNAAVEEYYSTINRAVH
jgi:hypothetical protein